jgi:hypothetical protein
MANVIRFIGVAAIGVGLILLAVSFWPLTQGQPFAILSSFLLNQAVAAISAGIITLGIGQLIAVNERVAENMEDLLDHLRPETAENPTAPAKDPPREALADVPSYNPRRDPRIVKEGTYRSHTVLTLEDGSVVIETKAGWKRFRTLRDFDRLSTA